MKFLVMAKICKIEGCDNTVFTHGYCLYHKGYYYKEKEKNKIYSSQKSKNKPIKKTGELNIFIEIWNEREHISFLSGKYLNYQAGQKFWINCFAHVLPKGKYPLFRLNKDNIILLTPAEHYLLDFGTHEQRIKYSNNLYTDTDYISDWGKIWAKRELLLNNYSNISIIRP